MSVQYTVAYPTVEEILRLPAFGGCLVRGGHAGLSLSVLGANTSDVPDYTRWVSQGELLITTGFAIAGDEQALSRLLPTAKRCGLSGVCIKPGRYLPRELPSWLVSQADELALPLIELPAAVRFSDLSGAVAQEIARRQIPQEQARQLAAYLLHLLRDAPEEGAERQAALEYGLHIEQLHLLVHLQAAASPQEQQWLLRDVTALCHRCGAEVWVTAEEADLLLVLESQGDMFAMEDRLRREMETFLSNLDGTEVICGISRPYSGIKGLSLANIGARAALSRARREHRRCLTDDRAGLLQLIGSEYTPSAVETYVQRQLAPILRQSPMRRQELLETLESWFSCFGNRRLMARELHIHYNTVSYRMQQLWQLLGKDPADYDARLSLELALYLYRARME